MVYPCRLYSEYIQNTIHSHVLLRKAFATHNDMYLDRGVSLEGDKTGESSLNRSIEG